jgi:hypothetical protein
LFVGPTGKSGVFVDPKETEADDEWIHEVDFVSDALGEGVVVHATARVHSWDPWLAATISGDRSLVDGGMKRRQTESFRISQQRGRAKNRMTLTAVPEEDLPPTIGGLPSRELLNIVRKIREGAASAGSDNTSDSDDA